MCASLTHILKLTNVLTRIHVAEPGMLSLRTGLGLELCGLVASLLFRKTVHAVYIWKSTSLNLLPDNSITSYSLACSHSGLIMRPNRSNMSDKVLEELMFLKCKEWHLKCIKFTSVYSACFLCYFLALPRPWPRTYGLVDIPELSWHELNKTVQLESHCDLHCERGTVICAWRRTALRRGAPIDRATSPIATYRSLSAACTAQHASC